jgi:hypothetical protein
MIDPVWNETADNSADFRQVLVDVYGPEAVNLTQIEDNVGIQYLVRALKYAAINLSPEDTHQTYLEENEDYGTDVIRISDVESIDCWYGYIYTQNKSKYLLKETLRPNLTGLEVVYPPPEGDEGDIELEIPAGQDHIVILRRIDNSCTYGLQYLTHQRQLEDSELEEMAKNMDEVNAFG